MSQRQHTVPKMYLRGFSDSKGRLRAFDRQRQREIPMSVNNASVVCDFYRLPPVPDGIDPLTVERLLSQKEGEASNALARIRKGEAAIEPATREALAEFIGLQLLRTSKQWEEVQEMGDWYGKVWFEGLSREDVAKRLSDAGVEPSEDKIDGIMEFVENPDKFRLVPPKGSFLLLFLKVYLRVLPYLTEGWNWIVVRSAKQPFLTSDAPVVLVGDTVDGGLGVANAEEIWLPVGRHHAVVLTRDFSLPPVLLGLSSDHVRRICQRIALEANRWVYWHPGDRPLKGIEVPRPTKRLRIETVGWRERPDNTVGEIVRMGPARPLVPGERLLSGRPVVNRRAVFEGLKSRGEVLSRKIEPAASGSDDD